MTLVVCNYDALMFTMMRRAIFGMGIAGLMAIVLRIFGGDGSAPQSGGWREIDPASLGDLSRQHE